MKCKECKDTMCRHRSTNAEQDCVLAQSCQIAKHDWEQVIDEGLHFQDGRIYSVEVHKKPDRVPYTTKKDITEDILDCLLRVLKKQESAARQEAIVRQLMNK